MESILIKLIFSIIGGAVFGLFVVYLNYPSEEKYLTKDGYDYWTSGRITMNRDEFFKDPKIRKHFGLPPIQDKENDLKSNTQDKENNLKSRNHGNKRRKKGIYRL